MSTQHERRVPRSFVLWGAVGLVLILVAGAAFAGVRAHDRGDLNHFLCEGVCGPQYASLPEGVTSLAPGDVRVAAAPRGRLDHQAVAAVVAPAATDPALGPHAGVSVREVDSGAEVLSTSADAFAPASTTKVLTGYAAGVVLDRTDRFTTSTVLVADDGPGEDTVVLVGGGDPYLLSTPAEDASTEDADLATLADATAAALHERQAATVRLGWDTDMFTGPAASAGWEATYVAQDIVTPISALWVDRGVHEQTRDDDPTAYAVALFAKLLTERGVAVSGDARPVVSDGAEALAQVHGAPIGSVIERMEQRSDNEAAEVLLRHVALATGRPGSFEGGIAAVWQVLIDGHFTTTGLELHDGSGLSRLNRITPALLTEVIARAARDQPSFVQALPVAGFTGTLSSRFTQLVGAGTIRAKTGTLTGVHSLAGTAVTADGVPAVFAVMTDATDDLPALETQAAIDRIAAALANCTCGAS